MQAPDMVAALQYTVSNVVVQFGVLVPVLVVPCHPLLALLLVLRIPFLGRFMCPLAVAGLGFKYLVTSSSDRLGHPFKKPFRNAFKREDILGLHIAWCPNLTVLALVRTECVNMAMAAFGVTCF